MAVEFITKGVQKMIQEVKQDNKLGVLAAASVLGVALMGKYLTNGSASSKRNKKKHSRRSRRRDHYSESSSETDSQESELERRGLRRSRIDRILPPPTLSHPTSPPHRDRVVRAIFPPEDHQSPRMTAQHHYTPAQTQLPSTRHAPSSTAVPASHAIRAAVGTHEHSKPTGADDGSHFFHMLDVYAAIDPPESHSNAQSDFSTQARRSASTSSSAQASPARTRYHEYRPSHDQSHRPVHDHRPPPHPSDRRFFSAPVSPQQRPQRRLPPTHAQQHQQQQQLQHAGTIPTDTRFRLSASPRVNPLQSIQPLPVHMTPRNTPMNGGNDAFPGYPPPVPRSRSGSISTVRSSASCPQSPLIVPQAESPHRSDPVDAPYVSEWDERPEHQSPPYQQRAPRSYAAESTARPPTRAVNPPMGQSKQPTTLAEAHAAAAARRQRVMSGAPFPTPNTRGGAF